MVIRTVTTLVDDLDGSAAEEEVSFGIDGVGYEIDLSTNHAADLRAVFAPYLAAARRPGRRSTGVPTRPQRHASSRTAGGPTRSRSSNAHIREWASQHGVELAERGRIPRQVIEAFDADDPSRLPHTGEHNSRGTADSGAATSVVAEDTSGTQPWPTSQDDEPRGRDGLTTSERDAVREWAVGQGVEVKPRGQLRKDLVANYRSWQLGSKALDL